MIDPKPLIDFVKFVWDVAKDYREARQNDGSLTASPLIALHESLRQLETLTELLLRKWLSEPRDPSSSETARNWYKALNNAVTKIGELDIATVRVYSPELAEILSDEIFALEAWIVRSFNRDELPLKYRRLILKIERRLREPETTIYQVFAPVISNQPNDGVIHNLRILTKTLRACRADLRAFIKDNFPIRKS